ncbi:MAG TPA: hypothetical protein VL147_04580 [Devosia sp.]|nr:hypothetical protein [Devosia sp.]
MTITIVISLMAQDKVGSPEEAAPSKIAAMTEALEPLGCLEMDE